MSQKEVFVTDVLRKPFPAEIIGKLPRVTCPKCSDRNNRTGKCDEHEKRKCGVCQAYVSERHIHIDYVGHADVTARLLEADPEWQWEPVATDEHGLPLMDADNAGNPVGLWIRLTVGGVSRLGYGSVPSGQADAVKVLIGDALRNAAMRFGVALDLWAKGDRADPTAENATGSGGQAARRQQRPAPAEPARAPATADPAVIADWGAKVDEITSQEDADKTEAELKQVFGAGRMDSTTANAIRNAIRARAASLGTPSAGPAPSDEDSQFASRIAAAVTVDDLLKVMADIRGSHKANAQAVVGGETITLHQYVMRRKADMEAQPEMAGAR